MPTNSNDIRDHSTHAERSSEMKEWIAFLLPPAMAFAGMRISRLVLGQKFEERFGSGLRFAIGLAVGMLVFSQAVLLGALAGVNLAGGLAWLALDLGRGGSCFTAAEGGGGFETDKKISAGPSVAAPALAGNLFLVGFRQALHAGRNARI